jgi:hypothetical protein
MNEPARRQPDVLLQVMLALGLLLTIGLCSGYRPWGHGPVNLVLLLGPILLAAALASYAARSGKVAKPGRGSTPAGSVVRVGLLMLLVGGCPWIYTPLLTGGRSNQASGMFGTIIFLSIGLPGLAVTAIGLSNLAAQRQARKTQKPPPDAGRLDV